MENKFFRDLFCFRCSLHFGGKSVYNLHQSLVHKSEGIEKSGDSQVKIEINSEVSESTNQTKSCILPVLSPVHEKSSEQGNVKIESVRGGKMNFECNICDASFSRKNNLMRHIESVHEGKKPFQCEICDQSWSQKKRSENAY